MRTRLLAALAALSLVVGISYLARPEPNMTLPLDATALDAPSRTADTTELDRLIALFETRAPERQESLEYRTLGGLYLERATLSSSVADYAGAASAFSSALDLAPVDTASKIGLARASLGTHDFTRAGDLASQVAASDATEIQAFAIAGDAALAMGDFATARTNYEALFAMLPGHPAVLLRMADLAAEMGDGDGAAEFVGRAIATAAIDLGPTAVAPYEAYAANQAFLAGQYDTALVHARKAVAADPANAGALSVLGDVLAATGDYEAAITAYADALAIAPNPGDLIATGNLARVLGDERGAAVAYAEAEEMIVATPESRRAHARTWANHLLDNGGDVSLALAIADEELATRTDTAGWETYAWALFKNDRLDEAREAIDVALDRGLDAHGYYRAGAISAARGETSRALAELTTALELSPRFHPIDATNAASLLAELGG